MALLESFVIPTSKFITSSTTLERTRLLLPRHFAKNDMSFGPIDAFFVSTIILKVIQ